MEPFYLYKDKDGNVQRATAGEPVSRDSIEQKVIAAQNEFTLWTGVLDQYDSLVNKPEVAKTTNTSTLKASEPDENGNVKFIKV